MKQEPSKGSLTTPLNVAFYLSSLSRQFTSLGRMPDLMRSSIGGLRSLDSSFLEKILKPKHLSHMHSRTAEIIQTINLACNKIRKR